MYECVRLTREQFHRTIPGFSSLGSVAGSSDEAWNRVYTLILRVNKWTKQENIIGIRKSCFVIVSSMMNDFISYPLYTLSLIFLNMTKFIQAYFNLSPNNVNYDNHFYFIKGWGLGWKKHSWGSFYSDYIFRAIAAYLYQLPFLSSNFIIY